MKKKSILRMQGTNTFVGVPKVWAELLGLKKGSPLTLELDIKRKEIIIKTK
ncbi:MAG: AbrB/MazE/SpoVT family DNA-binding domain-containing protein [Cetobacterium sp.]|uniref:AbrB/MazE/SpoVT family DNA-binding domain-containing protein n=1 Tax=Cetobacterium sp. TaxID=2071632 RepID=UPI003F351A0B